MSGLPNAVPGNAAACRAVLANTFRDGPGAHGNANKGTGRYGVKASKGMTSADQVRCNRLAHEAGRPRHGLVRLWRECGGVGRSEDGLGPTLRSPPNLSPMPVLVHTHPH